MTRLLTWGVILGLVAAPAWAAIDTHVLEQPWPKQRVRDYEVHKYQVRWRQQAGANEGMFAGASFVAPSSLEDTWRLAHEYQELATMTPGVEGVQVLEQSPTREVIQVRMKVLWNMLTLTFEIERDPPRATRFRLRHEGLGEYRGVCLMRPDGRQTAVELATHFAPAVRVPSGLVLTVQRMVMLRGIRRFLQTCERRRGD